jgi:uncharacterized membrane protein
MMNWGYGVPQCARGEIDDAEYRQRLAVLRS